MSYVNVSIPDSNGVVVTIKKMNIEGYDIHGTRYFDLCCDVANDMLRSGKVEVLFLNDLLKRMGAPLLREGQILGWKRENASSLNPIHYFTVKNTETEDYVVIGIPTDGVVVDTLESCIGKEG